MFTLRCWRYTLFFRREQSEKKYEFLLALFRSLINVCVCFTVLGFQFGCVYFHCCCCVVDVVAISSSSLIVHVNKAQWVLYCNQVLKSHSSMFVRVEVFVHSDSDANWWNEKKKKKQKFELKRQRCEARFAKQFSFSTNFQVENRFKWNRLYIKKKPNLNEIFCWKFVFHWGFLACNCVSCVTNLLRSTQFFFYYDIIHTHYVRNASTNVIVYKIYVKLFFLHD